VSRSAPDNFGGATRARLAALAAIAVIAPSACWSSDVASVAGAPADQAAATSAPLTDNVIPAPEPQFVAPTERDRIGRIWAPVLINGKGPFRLVLDTGATDSAVIASVALALGPPPTDSDLVVLHGVTGSATVPTIPVDTMVVGDVDLPSRRVAIVANVLGGADGILGTEGLLDKRITIEFRNDRITIARSRSERAGFEFITIPFKLVNGLPVVDAQVGLVLTKAVIDTGGEGTIGNLALRAALLRRHYKEVVMPDGIIGITLDVQSGNRIDTPPISLGRLTLQNVRVTAGDMEIFKEWHMTREPALLIGMDVLGMLDTLIIDYRRKELQVRFPRGS
jgi:predicted aspartyl protease